MRVLVVGGGVVGLLTAMEAALAGHDVTLVEQADLPNPGAASSDVHRVVRALHPSDPAVGRTALAAQRRWEELETLLGDRFFMRTGALTLLPLADLDTVVAAARAAQVNVRTVPPGALGRAYGEFAAPAGTAGVLEPDAGVLLAGRVLGSLLAWLGAHPRVRLRPRTRVVEVLGDSAAVRLAGGDVLEGDGLVVAAGAWAASLLGSASTRLTLYRQSMLYCSVPRGRAAGWRVLPVVLALGPAGAWLVPPVAGTPLKLSAATACREVAEVGDTITPGPWRAHLVEVFREALTDFDEDWLAGARDCYYLAGPVDGAAVVRQLGDRAVAFVACGGISFKFAPLVARSLLARVTGDRDSTVALPVVEDLPPVRSGAAQPVQGATR